MVILWLKILKVYNTPSAPAPWNPINIAMFSNIALMVMALLELEKIAKLRQHNQPSGLALDWNADVNAKDKCSLTLAVLDIKPRGLYVLAPGWLSVIITGVCSFVYQTRVAACALKVASGIFSIFWVSLIVVRGRFAIFVHTTES